MSVCEFREIFQQEIDKHLSKLEHRIDTTAEEGSERPRADVAQLRKLATQMTENILERISSNASYWGLSPEQASMHRPPPQADGSICALAEQRCHALQDDLQRKLAEEAECHQRLANRIRSEYESILKRRKEELENLRAAALRQPVQASELYSNFADNIDQIRKQLAATHDLVRSVDDKRQQIEKVEQQQRRPTPPVELVLTNTEDRQVEEEDRKLLENIRKGERVCKRMRYNRAEVPCGKPSLC